MERRAGHGLTGEAMFVAIAIHHVVPEHEVEMLAFMHRVIATTNGSPGLIDFTACREVSRGVLAGYSRWESQGEFQAALPRITSLAPERDPRWTDQSDEVIMLEVP
jgi:hypothetical protein